MAAETGRLMITDAVVLAAGLGERMRPLTLEIPKPAIHFLNRPVICSLLDSLAGQGVRRVFINTHHLPEEIVGAVSPFRDRMEMIFSHEPEILGTAGLFFNLKEKLNEEFFVLNGDIFLEPPLRKLEERLLGGRADAVLLLKQRLKGDGYTPVRLEEDGKVSSIGSGDHFFCGVYAAKRRFIEKVKERKKEGLVPLLLKPSVSSGKVEGESFDGPWHDLGSPRSFLDAVRERLQGMRGGDMEPPPGNRLVVTAACTALVDDSAVLSKGARLGGFVTVAGGCAVAEGALLENCVLLPGTVMAQGAEVRNSIVAGKTVLTI